MRRVAWAGAGMAWLAMSVHGGMVSQGGLDGSDD